jgi:hypothetical protein
MRCIRVHDIYGDPYIMYAEGDKHWDFKIIDNEYVMSPITGEAIPRNRKSMLDHIKEYPYIKPINRPL